MDNLLENVHDVYYRVSLYRDILGFALTDVHINLGQVGVMKKQSSE